METIVKNLVYESKRRFLTDEEISAIEDVFEGNDKVVILKPLEKVVEPWVEKIMKLPFPVWVDKEGEKWRASKVSPMFQARRYVAEQTCGKHLDARYKRIQGEYKAFDPKKDIYSKEMEQFKLLIYLNDLPDQGATRIYVNKDGESTKKTEEFIRIIPRKGHFVLYSLDMWHDGEKTPSPKGLIGFRIIYKRN